MNELTTRNENMNAMTTVDPSAVAARESARAMIESAYQMAMFRPRDEDTSRDRILTACKRPGFAEAVEYSKPISGKAVTGPSIRFIELAIREWGNVGVDAPVIYEDENIRRVRVTVSDFQTNARFSKDIQVRKTVERRKIKGREDDLLSQRVNSFGDTVFILRATDEEVDVKASSAISKAIRTEGGRLIPQDIVAEALEVARETLSQRDKKDPDASKRRLLDAFSGLGVKPKNIKEFLGHELETISPAELQTLRGVFAAISEGSATWADYVAPKTSTDGDQEPTARTPKDLASAIKGNTDKPKTTKAKEPDPVDAEMDAIELNGMMADLGGFARNHPAEWEAVKARTGCAAPGTREELQTALDTFAAILNERSDNGRAQ